MSFPPFLVPSHDRLKEATSLSSCDGLGIVSSAPNLLLFSTVIANRLFFLGEVFSGTGGTFGEAGLFPDEGFSFFSSAYWQYLLLILFSEEISLFSPPPFFFLSITYHHPSRREMTQER